MIDPKNNNEKEKLMKFVAREKKNHNITFFFLNKTTFQIPEKRSGK